MKTQLIGYLRVSTSDQNIGRQLVGVKLDKKFIDKVSGKNADRPALTELIDYAREGDTVIVHSLDRLGRNLIDLAQIVNTLTKKGIKVQFVKENLVFTGDDSPMSKLLFSMLGAVAEFERAIIRERQKEGITIAKAKGIYKGRNLALLPEQVNSMKARVNNHEKVTNIARDLNITRATIYNYLKKI